LGYGGGIYNEGLLSIVASTVVSNTAEAGGGVCGFYGTVNILNSAIVSNTATINGGAIANGSGSFVIGSALNVANSTLSGNRAYVHGGGIFHLSFGLDTVHLTNVTITDNTADADNNSGGNGGGIYSSPRALRIVTAITSARTPAPSIRCSTA
jgi:hypothetical protein